MTWELAVSLHMGKAKDVVEDEKPTIHAVHEKRISQLQEEFRCQNKQIASQKGEGRSRICIRRK